MGYELHLVKKGDWFELKSQFTENDWEKLKNKHSVADWLNFSSGDISVKGPEESQIIKLVKIAKENGWFVQGDDGETYSEDGSPIPPEIEKPSFFQPLKKLFREYKAKRAIKRMMKDVVCPFKIGDKVKMFGAAQSGVVFEIDIKAHHGIGSFTVKFPNGTVFKTFGFEAHTFKKEE